MVKIKLDVENRDKLKRLHTATHILNFASRKVLGDHVWQNGSNLKADVGTLDITHFDGLSKKEIFEIERLANKVVFENKAVKIEEIDRTKAEKKYGFTLYQGGAVPMKTLRCVSIDSDDVEACGGLHLERTGLVGLIKIVDSSKIQDGVVRLKFVVSDYALDFVEKKQSILSEVGSVFSVNDDDILGASEKFFREWKDFKKENDKLKDLLKSNFVESILSSKKDEFEVLGYEFDMGFLMDVFTKVMSKKESFKLVASKFVIATSDVSIEGFKKEIKKGKFNIYVM